MILTYHHTIKLADAAAQSYRALQARIARETDQHLSYWQLWRLLGGARRGGLWALPLCDAVDEHGVCRGHAHA